MPREFVISAFESNLRWNASTALILVGLTVLRTVGLSASAQADDLRGRVPLPEIVVDGSPVKIHTQGLYATDRSWLVTGRLEQSPKRPLLLCLPRDRTDDYTYFDLTVATSDGVQLDHPGGFDRDSQGVYWIPVSTSHRRGPTVILGMKFDEERPASSAISIVASIRNEDHIGAICCLPGGILLGANWDTKKIHRIRTNGSPAKPALVDWSYFVKSPGWQLAVQDWKYDADAGQIVASGIDKSPAAKADVSRAVIAWINPRTRAVKSERIAARDDTARPLTNEGMSFRGGELFLLPEDFGRGAKILQFDYRLP